MSKDTTLRRSQWKPFSLKQSVRVSNNIWSCCRVNFRTSDETLMIYKTVVTFKSLLRCCEVTGNLSIGAGFELHNCFDNCRILFHHYSNRWKVTLLWLLVPLTCGGRYIIDDIIATGKRSPLLRLAFVLIKLREPKVVLFQSPWRPNKTGFVLPQLSVCEEWSFMLLGCLDHLPPSLLEVFIKR